MNNILTIVQKELYNYFVSPVGYILTALFTVLSGLFFVLGLVANSSPDLSGAVYAWVIIFLLVAPFLTMGLLVDEWRSGTMELLMTSPLRDWQIVIGKFIGIYIFYLFMLLPTVLFAAIDFMYGKPEWGTMLTTYLALSLAGLLITAFGLMASSWTKSLVIAAGVAFVVDLFFWIESEFSRILGFLFGKGHLTDILDYIGLMSHVDNMSKGLIDAKDVVYFISLAILFIFIAIKSVEARRYSA